MVKLKVFTHSSGEFETSVEAYDPVEMDAKLNNNELNTVLIGDINISRIDVKLVLPVVEEEVENI